VAKVKSAKVMYNHPEGYKVVSQTSDARIVELRETSQYTR